MAGEVGAQVEQKKLCYPGVRVPFRLTTGFLFVFSGLVHASNPAEFFNDFARYGLVATAWIPSLGT